MAWISILGMYNYNNDIFDGFRTPENVDRQTVINDILLECAELELIYPEYETLKIAIKNWTDKEFTIWEELQKTREYKYNPIWNKDGTIKETISRDGSGSRTGNYTGSGESQNIHSVKGFNSNEWSEADKDNATATSGNTENISTTENEDQTLERIEQGNIGITTTQAMIREQREVVTFNTIEYIISSFKKRFCLLIY